MDSDSEEASSQSDEEPPAQPSAAAGSSCVHTQGRGRLWTYKGHTVEIGPSDEESEEEDGSYEPSELGMSPGYYSEGEAEEELSEVEHSPV